MESFFLSALVLSLQNYIATSTVGVPILKTSSTEKCEGEHNCKKQLTLLVQGQQYEAVVDFAASSECKK